MTTYTELKGYQLLSKFDSLKDFNDNFEQIMVNCKSCFTKGEYVALNKLRKFGGSEVSKGGIFGVAWVKLQKAVAATHMDALVGVSRSTFNRMLRKAKEIGLITVHEEVRKNGSQTHNVYIFNRLEDVSLPIKEVEIVSKSNTIDVADNEKLTEEITNNLFKLPIKKQVKDINITVTPNFDQTAAGHANIIETYAENEFQKATFELIEQMPMPEEIKENASTLALRVGEDATIHTFVRAKAILVSLAVQICEGLKVKNVVAAFTGALEKAKDREVTRVPAQPSKIAKNNQISQTYNWLIERE